jgi:hypothetical protein
VSSFKAIRVTKHSIEITGFVQSCSATRVTEPCIEISGMVSACPGTRVLKDCIQLRLVVSEGVLSFVSLYLKVSCSRNWETQYVI